jgi:hypothetical protein
MATRRFALALTAALLIGGCATTEPVRLVETVRVDVPVPTRMEPPAELLAPHVADLPVFVLPSDAAATSALTPDGERKLRQLINDLLTRLEAWRAWATSTQ